MKVTLRVGKPRGVHEYDNQLEIVGEVDVLDLEITTLHSEPDVLLLRFGDDGPMYTVAIDKLSEALGSFEKGMTMREESKARRFRYC